MGRKKKTTTKNTKEKKKTNKSNKTRKSTSSKKTVKQDFLGGVFVAIGIVIFILLVLDTGLGKIIETIKSIFNGFFGVSMYIIPFAFCIIGVYMIVSNKKVKPSKQLAKALVTMILLAATIGIFTLKKLNIFDNFMYYIFETCYNSTIKGTEFCGLFGGMIAAILGNLTGTILAEVILCILTFFCVLCVFNISLKQFFYSVYNVFAYIVNGIYKAFKILFRKDEIVDEDEFEIKEEKISKRELKRRAALEAKMKEKGGKAPEENLVTDRTEQVEFDFNKLGGKPTPEEELGKQRRDEFFKQQKEEKEDKSIKEVLTLEHNMTNEPQIDNYEIPPVRLLKKIEGAATFDKKAIQATAVKLQKTLASFGVEAKVTNITKGPTVTRYELTPNIGVKVSKIVNLSDDIALNLAAKSIRIEAPIPGRAAVGIEIPNSVTESVSLREVIESDTFKSHKSKVCFALGKDAAGEIQVGDISKMPHMLIAGATGSGKSVCINSIIVSILYKAKPSEVKLILIDPKMVELSCYNGIPHLLVPVVTDPRKAAGSLNWAVQEMVSRYSLFAAKGVKDIKSYNSTMEKENGPKLPQVVIIVDELADLMMVAPNDVEDAICRLAQMARAAGMHLVIATQRPSVDVITGIIKANIPSRIAFTVSSQVDSRTILDMAGAEKLLGKGDMLYFPVGETKPLRMQGTFISEEEIEKVVSYIKEHTEVTYSDDIIESIENMQLKSDKKAKPSMKEDNYEEELQDEDPLLDDAISMCLEIGQASTSYIQRKFKVGHSRAGRIVDQMEERGIVGGYEGSKPRKVLISKEEWQEIKFRKNESVSDSENGVEKN